MPRTPSKPEASGALVEPTTLGRAMGEVAFYRERGLLGALLAAIAVE